MDRLGLYRHLGRVAFGPSSGGPTPVGTELLRFQVQILELGTKPDPFQFGLSLTTKPSY
jgi:hypothetical protein